MTLIAQAMEAVLAAPRTGKRKIVALAGAPASGKSTLAEDLARALTDTGISTQVIPMDGFHLDNALLKARGLLHRKGAPETFDKAGLLSLVQRLRTEDDIYFPIFDRTRDLAIAGAGQLGSECDTVIVEGNYLLMNTPGWRELVAYWDHSILLSVPMPVLTERLIRRWRDHGLSADAAQTRAQENDLINAQLVIEKSAMPTVVLTQGE